MTSTSSSTNRGLRTPVAADLLSAVQQQARPALALLNERRFKEAIGILDGIRNSVAKQKSTVADGDEAYLNDIFVILRYVDFLSEYCVVWQQIVAGQFSDSWSSLQNALTLLRVVKRFSSINITFFEDQVTELEKTYPYNVFFSIGIAVDRFECSICHRDIDSLECPHRRGKLYAGEMASAIAREIRQLDHVAIVRHPEDKRCVVQYPDAGEQFKLVRLLSQLIASGRCRISDFSHLRFSKRPLPNPEYKKRGRNEPCFCGSGRKFKRCCIGQQYIESDHVDLIAEQRDIDAALC